MNRRYFFTAVGVLCALWAGNNLAFGQWPGESKAPRVDSDFWPGASQKPTGNYVPPNAENFVCTFDYLSPAQIPSLMGMGPHGKPMCPSSPSNYGSYFSGDRQEALERLIEQAGVRQDRIVTMEKAGLQNAVAMLCEDYDGEVKQLVVWDPHFLGELDRKAGTNWASVAVLAHELAHHLNNDTGQNPGRIPPHERREQELYADRYAGQKLRAFGVSKDNAVAVFHHLGAGGDTHPSADERVVMAGEGWEAGRAQTVEDVPPPDDRDYPGSRKRDFDPPPPPPPPPPMATVCLTQFGICQMMTPLQPGAPCRCFTPMGAFPGMAQ